ncbi:MAG: hypothetical protein AB8G99_09500 [Planctomycetaceae bacterium]
MWSLVERGTYRIDEIQKQRGWETIDKARHRLSEDAEWHEYSTKPPLTPTLIAGVYYVVKKTTGLSLYKRSKYTTRIILLFINVLPMVIALMLLSRMLLRHCENSIAGLLVLIAACFGTLLTPFLTTLNNHSIAATGVFFTIYFASRILIDGSRSSKHFALAGFFAMWTCCNELPAAIFGLTFFWLLFRVDRRRTLLAFAPAALVPLAGFFVTNYAATGSWKPLYMYYGTDRYVYTVDGVPSYWVNPKGLDANQEAPLTYLFHCVFGHHGILSLTPVFLLTVFSLLSPKSWKHPLRPFLMPAAFLTVVTLAFYLSRTQNYNYGGTSSGLRWAFWLIPFWLVAMVPLIERWAVVGRSRLFVGSLLVLSVGSTATALPNPWGHPWLYNVMRVEGLINYAVPPPKLGRDVGSWLVAWPDLTGERDVTVTYHDENLPHNTLSLVARRTNDADMLTIDAPHAGLRDVSVVVNSGALQAGSDASSFVEAEGFDPSEVIRFFNGLPVPKAFRVRRIQYLKTSLRTDAFECRHLSATVYQSSESRKYRCDIWMSDEVPFGTVAFQTTVSDMQTDAILGRQTWKITSIERSSVVEGID